VSAHRAQAAQKIMLRFQSFVFTALISLCATGCSLHGKIVDVVIDELPTVPPAPGQVRQAGLASPFAGAHGEVLIVAGGANFPDRPPWESGGKVWWDDIFVLERKPNGAFHWVTDKTFKLPRPLAYGMSFNTPDGVVFAGGCDAAQCYRDVFLVAWDARTRDLKITPLPPLPEPLAFMAGASVGTMLYMAGGQHSIKDPMPSSAFWSLDLSNRGKNADFKWQVLPTWPGPPRVVPVAASAGKRGAERFFLFSGRKPRPGSPTEILTDSYAFDPARREWQALGPVGVGRNGKVNRGVSVMAGNAVGWADEIIITGGDRGDLFLRLEAYDLEIEKFRRQLTEASPADREKLQHEIDTRLGEKKKIYENHPGFGREVFVYDPAQDAWRVITESQLTAQVTTIGVPWGNAVVVPSGEVRPGIRSPRVPRLTPIAR
jgi:N-acetylneuraminic acid mutarotase